jgi:Transposase DDE domain.
VVIVKIIQFHRGTAMLPTDELFVYCYTLVDDLILDGQVVIPSRPGPDPGCSDAEILAIVLVRHLLHRPSESGFLAEIRRDFSGWFPKLPHHSEFNRRARWLWGAFEQTRVCLADLVPADDWGQVDTSALPVKHPSRVRGPDSWTGPNGLAARFGRDAAHAEWFYGFRLAARTDMGSRLVRAWAIVPAAVNERDLVPGLIEGAHGLCGLLADKGFNGKKFAESLAAEGIEILVPPTKKQRATMSSGLQKVIAEWRNRIETTFGEITDQMTLARHGAHSFWGLLTRTASTIAAHTLYRIMLADT